MEWRVLVISLLIVLAVTSVTYTIMTGYVPSEMPSLIQPSPEKEAPVAPVQTQPAPSPTPSPTLPEQPSVPEVPPPEPAPENGGLHPAYTASYPDCYCSSCEGLNSDCQSAEWDPNCTIIHVTTDIYNHDYLNDHYCIVFGGENRTIDCGGHTMYAYGSSYAAVGIYVQGGTNLTIRNCTIKNFAIDIYAGSVTYLNITNVTIYQHTHIYPLANSQNGGIAFVNVSNSYITNSTLYNVTPGYSVINFTGSPSTFNTISGNNISMSHGIFMYSGSSDNIVSNNNFSSLPGVGVYSGAANSITNNNFTSFSYGVQLSASGNDVNSNNITNGYYGIYIPVTNNNDVTGNNITDNYYGFYLYHSYDNNIFNNRIERNSYGIYFDNASSFDIENNLLLNNSYGIYIPPSYASSTDNIFKNNGINGSTIANLYFGGYVASPYTPIRCFYQDIDTSNTVNGKPIYYWTDETNAPNSCTNAEINESDDPGFVALISCDNIVVKNVNVSTVNSHGILMVNTNNSKITNSTLGSNTVGLEVGPSINNNFTNITVINNTNYGILFEFVQDSNLTNSTLTNGIYVDTSDNLMLRDINLTGAPLTLLFSNNTKITYSDISNYSGTLIDLDGALFSNISYNNITNSDIGILLHETASNNTIIGNNISMGDSAGIFSVGGDWNAEETPSNNSFLNNSISSNHVGINITGGKNNLVDNNNFFNNDYGIGLRTYVYDMGEGYDYYISTNNNFTNNNITNSGNIGIYLVNITNNTFINTNISNSDSWDFYAINNSTANTVINMTINNTPLDFKFKDVAIWGYDDSLPDDPPAGYTAISHVLSISNRSSNSWLYLNLTYKDEDISNNHVISESTVQMWKYKYTGPGAGWSHTGITEFPLNQSTNVVSVNITGFSDFIPLGLSSEVDECQSLTYGGGTYYLINDIYETQGGEDYCIDFANDSITLDCQGHSIIGDGESIGVNIVNWDNITLRNCTITDYNDEGVYLYNDTNSNISDNQIVDNGVGIYAEQSSGATVSNNNLSINGDPGIYFTGSSNYVLLNNTVNSNGYGIYLEDSFLNNFTNNTVQENTEWDVYMQDSSESTCNNIFTDTNGSGGRPIEYYNSTQTLSDQVYSELMLCNADGSNLDNITVNGSDSLQNNGIVLEFTDDTNITNSNSIDNAVGIYAFSSSNNMFVNNNLTYNNNYGFALSYNSQDNNLTGNNLSLNYNDGLLMSNSGYNNLTGNDISSNGYSGILMDGENDNNTFNGNNVSLNGNNGVLMSWEDENNTFNENDISLNGDIGIVMQYSHYNTFNENNASLNSGSGVYLTYSENNMFEGNNFSENDDDGIYLAAASYYNTFDDTNALLNGNAGVYLTYSSSYNTFERNNFSENTNYGIYLATDSDYNNFTNNNATDNEDEWDFYADGSVLGTTVTNLTFSTTTTSFEFNGIAVASATLPGTLPYNRTDIGKFIQISDTGGDNWAYFNISYNESEIGVDENILGMWKWDGGWYRVHGSGVNNVSDYVYSGNVTSFSTFGPITSQMVTCECDSCSYCSDQLANSSCDIIKLNQSISSPGYTCIESDSSSSDKILDCQGYNITAGSGYYNGIYSSSSTNFTINNCTVFYFNNGIILDTTNDTRLTNSTIFGNADDGIYLGNTNNATLIDNNVSANDGYGIDFDGNNNNATLTNNNVSENYIGIYLYNTGYTTMTSNAMTDNHYNFYYTYPYHDNNNVIDTSNTVDGKPIYFVKNINDTVYDYSSNAGAVYCFYCNNVTVRDLELNNNGQGVQLYGTTNSEIINITADTHDATFTLGEDSNISVTDSTLMNYDSYGITSWSSDNITITNNNLSSGLSYAMGIAVEGVDNSLIKNNTLQNHYYAMGFYGMENMTVEDNIVSGSSDAGLLCEYEAWGSRIINNTVYETLDGSGSNFYGAITLSEGCEGALFANNTLYDNYVGIRVRDSSNNILENNNITNSTFWDFYAADTGGPGSVNNTVINLTTEDVTSSFEFKDISLTHVNPIDRPADSNYTVYKNISKYLNVTNYSEGAWAFINISYSDSDVHANHLSENTLTMWKYSGGNWQILPSGTSDFAIDNSGLVSHWQFENNLTDEKGLYDLSNDSEVYYDSGQVDYGTQGDGSTNWLYVADSDSFTFGNGTADFPFTISAWINIYDMNNVHDTPIRLNGVPIFGKINATASKYEYSTSIVYRNPYFCLFNENTTTDYRCRYSSTDLDLWEWYHIVYVYDGRGGTDAQDGMKIYVNGVRVDDSDDAAGSYTAMNTSGQVPYTLGNLDGGDTEPWYLDGMIDELRVYNRTLNDSEITNLYNNESGTIPIVQINDVDTVNNIVYANITDFGSIFAPLGGINNLPTADYVYANTTYVRNSSDVLIATNNAADIESDSYRLECGDTPGTSNLCNSSYVASGEANCTFTAPWTDHNTQHYTYCRLNDTNGYSNLLTTFVISDNNAPLINIVNPANNTVMGLTYMVNTSVSDSPSGISTVEFANSTSSSNCTGASWSAMSGGSPYYNYSWDTDSMNTDSWLCVRATDIVGNSAIVSHNVSVDNTVPVLTLTSVASDISAPYWDTSNDSNTLIIATASENLSGCRWSATDAAYSSMTNDCTVFNNITQCPLGSLSQNLTYTYYISCKDIAGNENTNSNNLDVTFGVDWSAPTTYDSEPGGIHTPGWNVTITEADVPSGTTIWTWYCNDTTGTCSPVTEICISSSAENVTFNDRGVWYLRYYSNDSANNIQAIKQTIVLINRLLSISPQTYTNATGRHAFNVSITVSDSEEQQFLDNGSCTLYYSNDSWSTTYTKLMFNTSATMPKAYTAEVNDSQFPGGSLIETYVNCTDGLEWSNTTTSSNRFPNTAPSVAGVTITPNPANSTADLNCTVASSSDSESDPVSFYFRWYNGSTPVLTEYTANMYSVLNEGNTTKGEVWTCQVIPYDTYINGTDVNASAYITSTPPSVAWANVTPTTAYTNDTLTCENGTISDPDSDPVTLYYRWFVNDSLISGQTSQTLGPQYSVKHDNVTCEITPNDGANGIAVNSSNRTIINIWPTVNTAISFTNATTYHGFNATARFEDLDGQSDIILFGETLSGGNCTYLKNNTISSTVKEVIYNCTGTLYTNQNVNLTATDSEGLFAWTAGQNAYPDAAPSVTGVTITPNPANSNTDLNCSIVSYSDPESDPVSFYFRWWNGSNLVLTEYTSNMYSILDDGNTSNGDVWICQVIPYDTYVNGTDVNATAYILSGAPSVAWANVTNATEGIPVYTNDTLKCTNGTTSDPDSDPVTLYYRWFLNDSLISGQTSQTLGPQYSVKHDNVSCEITPGDGYVLGNAVNSTNRTILNLAPFIVQNQTYINWTNERFNVSAQAGDTDGLTDIVSCRVFHGITTPSNITSGTYNPSTGVCITTVSGYSALSLVETITEFNDTDNARVNTSQTNNIVPDTPDVNRCRNLTTQGMTYQLTQNLSGLQPSRNMCIDIQADDITLNCQGVYNNISSGSGSGIYALNRDNVTIKNCTVRQYIDGVYLESVNNSNVMDSNLRNNNYGIALNSSSTNNTLTRNNMTGSIYGIYLDNSVNTNITDSNASSNGAINPAGIYVISSNRTLVRNTTANSNDYGGNGFGIYIKGALDSVLINNTAVSNGGNGILINESLNNNITNNNASLNNGIGIYLISSPSSLTNNTANGIVGVSGVGQNYGIIVKSSDYSNLTNNTARMNYYTNIELENSNNNQITNCTVRDSRSTYSTGIELYNSSYNNLTNNTAKSFLGSDAGYGIIINYLSNNNTLTNNTISANPRYGLFINSSNGNILNANIIYSNQRNIYMLNVSGTQVNSNRINCTSEAIFGCPNQYGLWADSSSDITIFNNTVINQTYGIHIQYLNNSNLTDNNLSLNTYGIHLYNVSGNRLVNNTAKSNSVGMVFDNASNNNTIINNTINLNSGYGISINASSSNTFTNNNASFNTLWDVYATDTSTDNIFTNLTTNDTTSSFTFKDIALRDSQTEPANPNMLYKNITKYLNITNNSADSWVYLNLSYSDSDWNGRFSNESSIQMWKHNGTNWTQAGITTYPTNTTTNIAYANITGFSIFAPFGYTTLISNCTNLTVANVQYNLTSNLYGLQPGRDVCIDVQANNITLDCGMFNITGSYTGRGIYTNLTTGLTIKNCMVANYSNGFYLRQSSNNNLIDNTVYNSSSNGVIITEGSNNNTLTNNKVYHSSYNGISTSFSQLNNFTNNIIDDSGYNGIFGIYSVDNLTLTNNTISGTNQSGIDLQFGINNTYNNNTIYDTNQSGIISSGSNSIFINNTVYNAKQHGIYLNSAGNNVLMNNTVYNNIQYGIGLSSSSNSILINNSAYNNSYGIYLKTSSVNNILYNSNISDNTNYGIFVNSSSTLNWTINESGYLTNNPANLGNSNITVSGTLIALNSSINNSYTNITSTGTMVYRNSQGTNIISGNLFISGNYTLDNAILNMNCSTNGGCGINVNGSGRMDIGNNSLISHQTSNNYTYSVYGAINIDNSTVEYVYNPGFVIYSSWNRLTNSIFRNSNVGIYLQSASNNTITKNTVTNNNKQGIYLVSSSNNTFTNNTANSNNDVTLGYGIQLTASSNNTFTNNTANSNGNIGIYFISSSLTNNLTNNTANLNQYGIVITNSPNNNLTNNTANSNSHTGFYISSSSYNILDNNTAYNNSYYGIWLSSLSNNTLIHNTVTNNKDRGIYLASSLDNNLTNNNVTNNTVWDFYSTSSSTNNTVINLTTNDTLVSFAGKDIALRDSQTEPANPTYHYTNITKYLNITNNSADSFVYINLSYSEINWLGRFSSESSIQMWKYNGTNWTQAGIINYPTNTATNTVFANLTSFSIFAPLGFSNNLPAAISVSANVTYVRNGTGVRVVTSGASDADADNYRLECGDTPGTSNLCIGSYVANGTETDCNFTALWTDHNVQHNIYCRLNDSYNYSSTMSTFVISDNNAPLINIVNPANNTVMGLIYLVNASVSDSPAGVSTVEFANSTTSDNCTGASWSAMGGGSPYYNYSWDTDSMNTDSWLCVRATDIVGNSAIVSHNVTLDNSGPVINIVSVASDTTVPYWDTSNDGSTIVVVNSTEDFSACRWSNTTTDYDLMANNCTTVGNIGQCQLGSLSQNISYTYYVACKDLAGNKNYTTVIFGVDWSAPTTYDSEPGGIHLPGWNVTITEADLPPGTIVTTWYCNDTTGLCTPTTIIANNSNVTFWIRGINYLRYYSNDSADNQQTPLKQTLVLINNLPTISSQTYTNSTTHAFNVSVNVDDADTAQFIANGSCTLYYSNDSWSTTYTKPMINISAGMPRIYTAEINDSEFPVYSTIQTYVNCTDGMEWVNTTTASNAMPNSAPSMSAVVISPKPADTTDDLTCTIYGSSDSDGDTVNYYFNWTNGVTTLMYYTGSTSTTLLADNTTKGETWTCIVTPFDGYINGTALNDSVLIQNSGPAVATSIWFVNISGTHNFTANARFSDLDSAADIAQFNVTPTSNCTYVSNFTESATVVNVTYMCSGTPYAVENVNISATDFSAAVAWTAGSNAYPNTAPSVAGVTITPNPANSTNDLNCTIATYNDAESDPVSYYFIWWNGSTQVLTEYTTNMYSVLAEGNTSKNQIWTCQVIPYDGYINGTDVNASAYIFNTAPTVAWANVTNATEGIPVYTNDTLKCTNGSVFDADSDPVTLYYRWFVNDLLVSGQTSQTLGPQYSVKHDNVTCEITPNDGTNGVAINSTNRTILNLAPFIVQNQTYINWTNERFNVSAQAGDTDGLTDIVSCRVFHGITTPSNITSGTYNPSTGVCITTVSGYPALSLVETITEFTDNDSAAVNTSQDNNMVPTTVGGDCTNLTGANVVYTMVANVTGLQPGRDICIDVQANNITLDCQGYYISWNKTGRGVYSKDRNNTTIHDCNVYNYSNPISLNNASYDTIDSNRLWNCTICLNYTYGGYSNITNNNISNSTGNLIYMNRTPNVTIANNNLFEGKTVGIGGDASTNLTIFNNRIVNTTRDAIYIWASTNANISNNFVNTSDEGIGVSTTIGGPQSSGHVIFNNTVTNYTIITTTSSEALYLHNVTDSFVSNNNLSGHSDGILISTAAVRNTILNNNISLNKGGITISSSSVNNMLYNSNISDNTNYGISVDPTSTLNWTINESGYLTNNPANLGNSNITVSGTLIALNSSINNSRTNITSTGSMEYRNSPTTNIISGNFTISGNYTLDNATLKMNCSSSGSCGINETSTGLVNVGNNSLITAYNSSAANYTFKVNGSINVDNSTVEFVSGYPGFAIYSNGNSFTNSIFRNSYTGIAIMSSNNTIITNNIANNNTYYGISLYSSANNNNLTNNTVYNNSNAGITLMSASYNNLTNNTADYNYMGIWLNIGTNYNTLINNTANNNNYSGIAISNMVGNSYNNTLINNTANYNRGAYAYGILISNSYNNTIFNNTANYNNITGIWLSSAYNNTLTNNTANSNNNTGIQIYSSGIYHSDNNILSNNTANSNNNTGIALILSNNTIITDNIASSNNNIGISLTSSNNTTTANNTATNNTVWDYYSASNSLDNNVTNLTVNANLISFESEDIALRHVDVGTEPADPTYHYTNITRYLNITNNSANSWTYLNLSYADSDWNTTGIFNELSISWWKDNATGWTQVPNVSNINIDYSTDDIVSANVSDFGSIFAPLGFYNNAPASVYRMPPSGSRTVGNNPFMTINATDVDNDTLTYYIYADNTVNATTFIYNGSALQGTAVSTNLTTTDGVTYYWKANISDGTTNTSLPIWNFTENTAPLIGFVKIAPPVANYPVTLTCVVGAVSDPEGDNLTYTYRWFSNGTLLSTITQNLYASNYTPCYDMICEASVSDGYETTVMNSSIVHVYDHVLCPRPREGGGGGGGGGGAPARATSDCLNNKEVSTFTSGKANEILETNHMYCLDLHLHQLQPKQDIKNVVVEIWGIDERGDIPINPNGFTYKYFRIEKANIDSEQLAQATFIYRVPKTWVAENNIDPYTVRLSRYNYALWDEAYSGLTGEDKDYYYYEAQSTQLSVYAIAGQKVSVWSVLDLINSYYNKQINFLDVVAAIDRYYAS